MSDDVFSLSNGPAPMKKLACPQQKARQGVLFSGWKSCLPGQLDLLPTDGREQEQEPEALICTREEGEPSTLEGRARLVSQTANLIDPEIWLAAGHDIASAVALAAEQSDRSNWRKFQDLWVLSSGWKTWHVWTLTEPPVRLRPATDAEVCLAVLHPLSHLVIDGREHLITY